MIAEHQSDVTWYNTDASPTRKTWPWVWFGLLAAGVIVLEVFADPALIICVACGKLGWNDLVSAIWLLRRDPNRQRGGTWFWLYLAHGFWKVTITAMIVTLLLWFTADFAPRHWRLSTATVLLCLAAFSVSAIITIVSVFLACRRRVRVWINSSIHQSRRRDEFPPQITGPNHSGRLIFTAALLIFLLGLAGFILGAIALIGALRNVLPPNGNGSFEILAVIILSACPILLGCLILMWRDKALDVLSARSPDECWTDHGR